MTDTDTPRGLTLTLLRSKSFGTNADHNLLAGVEEVTAVEIRWADGRVTPMPADSRVLPARPAAPAVALVQRFIFGDRPTWHVQPVTEGTIWTTLKLPAKAWLMAGGTFAETSDSRLNAIVEMYGALSVHDWLDDPSLYGGLRPKHDRGRLPEGT